jgi:hypothetical protein
LNVCIIEFKVTLRTHLLNSKQDGLRDPKLAHPPPPLKAKPLVINKIVKLRKRNECDYANSYAYNDILAKLHTRWQKARTNSQAFKLNVLIAAA